MRNRIGRRRFDRIVFGLAIVGVLALLAYMGACEKDGPTIPDDPVVTQPSVPVAVTPAPVPVEVTPTAGEGESTDPDFVTSWKGCTLFIEAKKSRTFPVKAFAHRGANIWDQFKVWEGTIDVKRGHNEFSFCFLKELRPGCRMQIDVGNLLTYKWLDGTGCDPECVEEEPVLETKCGEWNECHEHPQANHVSSSTTENGCYQERLCTETSTWKCKDPTTREFEEVQPCDCECKEGGPYEEDPVWVRPILEGPCPGVPAPSASVCHVNGTQKTTWDCQDPTTADVCKLVDCPCETEWSEWSVFDTDVQITECAPIPRFTTSTGGPECQQTITTIIIWERFEKCSGARETKRTQEIETEPCDCDEPGEGCHLSNQGGPGETNFNIVITNAPYHAGHSQAAGFCPGDLPGDCSCALAEAAAAQCGDPAAGGFFCKDER